MLKSTYWAIPVVGMTSWSLRVSRVPRNVAVELGSMVWRQPAGKTPGDHSC